MNANELIKELQLIQTLLFDKQHYESATQITLAIDVIEDLLSSGELNENKNDNLSEVRLFIKKTLNKDLGNFL